MVTHVHAPNRHTWDENGKNKKKQIKKPKKQANRDFHPRSRCLAFIGPVFSYKLMHHLKKNVLEHCNEISIPNPTWHSQDCWEADAQQGINHS